MPTSNSFLSRLFAVVPLLWRRFLRLSLVSFVHAASTVTVMVKGPDLRAPIHRDRDGIRGNRGNVKFRAVFVELVVRTKAA